MMTPGRLAHLRALADYVTYVGAGQSPDAHNDMLELCDAAAAVPELLELLKSQRDRLGDGRNVEGWVAEWLEEIDAAIAKAEGR
jgi:hypothetical protein